MEAVASPSRFLIREKPVIASNQAFKCRVDTGDWSEGSGARGESGVPQGKVCSLPT